METLTARLAKLGEAVAEVSDRRTDLLVLETARRRWLQPSPVLALPRSSARRPLLLLAAACVTSAALVVAFRPATTRVSFAVGAAATPGIVGEWIAADDNVRIPVRFSEGTSVTLRPGAKIRVVATSPHGADVLLEQGSLNAAVVHAGPDTRWSLRAGPFDVHVTGTQFDASWDPTAETFDLAMGEGRVVVRGPLLPSWREITTGERLHVSIRSQAMELRSSRLDVPVGPAPVEPPVVASGLAPQPVPPTVAPAPVVGAVQPPTSASAGDASNWRELATGGKYRDALAAAERAGFVQTLDRASASDLLLLADAARFAARPSLARQALLALRSRFGARGRSAFLLGKIAADQQGVAAEAVRWFELYLSEEPNGGLAEQALGRILELRKSDPASATSTAKRYLARYPSGAYAPLARSLVTP